MNEHERAVITALADRVGALSDNICEIENDLNVLLDNDRRNMAKGQKEQLLTEATEQEQEECC